MQGSVTAAVVSKPIPSREVPPVAQAMPARRIFFHLDRVLQTTSAKRAFTDQQGFARENGSKISIKCKFWAKKCQSDIFCSGATLFKTTVGWYGRPVEYAAAFAGR